MVARALVVDPRTSVHLTGNGSIGPLVPQWSQQRNSQCGLGGADSARQ